ncbi:MAG: hypothetical protein Fur0043_11470 [Anaerolineales bacterium]
MNAIGRFLAAYEGFIYIVLILGGLFSFRWLWRAWQEWRASVFGLEREFALRRLSQALTISLLIVLAFLAELFLASFITPALPAADVLMTPTLDLLHMQEGALYGAPSSIALTTPPAASANPTVSGCIPDQLALTAPQPEQEVSGKIRLEGTVSMSNLGFYKFEVSPKGEENWTTIFAGTKAVINDEIGGWDTSMLTPGEYEMRLVVTDNRGQSLPPCIVPVRVTASQ